MQIKMNIINKLNYLAFFIGVSLLYSCSNQTEIPEGSIPQKVNIFAKAYIENIHNGNIDDCLNVSGTEINNETGRMFLNNAYKNIKDGKAKSTKVVGYSITKAFGHKAGTYYVVDYEYNYGKFVYFSLNIQEKNNTLTVLGFNGQIFDKSLSEINKFTFSGKKSPHYLFLFIIFLIPFFIILTIIYIVKTPMKRKWLWIIGVLVGVMSFNLNWTTGDFGFWIFSFNLLGIGFTKPGIIAPWFASFSLPLFAIIFWLKRKSFIEDDKYEKFRVREQKELDELLKAEKTQTEESI